MDRIFQKAQLMGAETSTKVNDLFRQKVQLEDQLKDTEAQIHYARGVLDCVGEIQTFITQTKKQDAGREQLEEEKAKYEQEQLAQSTQEVVS